MVFVNPEFHCYDRVTVSLHLFSFNEAIARGISISEIQGEGKKKPWRVRYQYLCRGAKVDAAAQIYHNNAYQSHRLNRHQMRFVFRQVIIKL